HGIPAPLAEENQSSPEHPAASVLKQGECYSLPISSVDAGAFLGYNGRQEMRAGHERGNGTHA
ncbi:MAG: hypothetical protein IIZ60_04545, partial [Clostridia bacterium]|nr:hypothetical protein [Clostridia bacterium]